MPNGNVLIEASPCNQAGSQFFEFDGMRLNPMPSPSPTGGPLDEPSFIGRMLVLPTGEIFFTDIGDPQIYTPSGTYQLDWAPSIKTFPSKMSAGRGNYIITGKQFNGLSQGAMYGDDAQMATNYPLVRITNDATGHVFYARTHDHSSMGVATGSAIVSTSFDVPIDIETGASKLFVVANGIPSEPVAVEVTASTLYVQLDQHGLTGSWYNPATSGQGFELEVYPDLTGVGQATLFGGWFTYDVTTTGGRRWYGLSGSVNGSAVATLQIFDEEGGSFDGVSGSTAFGPLGEATIRFSDCNTGILTYNFTDGSSRSGTIPLKRLTPNVTCAQTGDNGAAASNYLLSGNWFNPDTSGQGLMFDFSPSLNLVFATWYTFKPNGQQVGGAASQDWFTLQSDQFAPGQTALANIPILEANGGVFDSAEPTTSAQVGTADIAIQSCSAMTLQYRFTSGTNQGLAGTINLQRAGPAPLGCKL
jgi:hypothetical protein